MCNIKPIFNYNKCKQPGATTGFTSILLLVTTTSTKWHNFSSKNYYLTTATLIFKDIFRFIFVNNTFNKLKENILHKIVLKGKILVF